jgi:hypothetical protein
LYRRWVESNRTYILQKSGGRLGYVHMIDMSQGALDQLYVDLDTENHARDGVVIDIRNISGGFENAYAIDVFTRQPYLRMSTRGVPGAGTGILASAPRVADRARDESHSLSDAEDFTGDTLKLGPVVGEPTAGGSSTPECAPRRWLDVPSAAHARERRRRHRHGAPPAARGQSGDAIGESLVGQDSQLDEAIRVLLKLERAERI